LKLHSNPACLKRPGDCQNGNPALRMANGISFLPDFVQCHHAFRLQSLFNGCNLHKTKLIENR
jgi:hypothetical protein